MPGISGAVVEGGGERHVSDVSVSGNCGGAVQTRQKKQSGTGTFQVLATRKYAST